MGFFRRCAQISDLKMFNRDVCFTPVRHIEGLSFRIYRFQEGFVTQLGSDLGRNNDQTECLLHPFWVDFGMRISPLVLAPVFFSFLLYAQNVIGAPGRARVFLPPLC